MGSKTFDRVFGKKTAALDPAWLAETAAQYDSVEFDVGTGNGHYVLDCARSEPTRLVVGIDPVVGNMADIARKAGRTPAKGGAPNALFLRGAAEQLPGPFAGMADQVTINYPWGSLLKIVAVPQASPLRLLRVLCRTGAALRVLLNYDVLIDAPYAERLGLPTGRELSEDPDFAAVYAAAGFEIEQRSVFAGDPDIRTKWGRHLIRGSQRQTFLIDAKAV